MSKNALMRRLSSSGGHVVRYGKPPTIVFLVCLLTFIFVLFSFILYLKAYDVKNPDELDWNIFREKMASLDYCIKYPQHGNDAPLSRTSQREFDNELVHLQFLIF